jgi:hypothetical protein
MNTQERRHTMLPSHTIQSIETRAQEYLMREERKGMIAAPKRLSLTVQTYFLLVKCKQLAGSFFSAPQKAG